MVCLKLRFARHSFGHKLPPPETAIVADKKAGPNGLTCKTHEWNNCRSITKLHPDARLSQPAQASHAATRIPGRWSTARRCSTDGERSPRFARQAHCLSCGERVGRQRKPALPDGCW